MKTLISSPVLQASSFVIHFDAETAKLLFYEYSDLFYDEMTDIEEIASFEYDGAFGPMLFYKLTAENVKTKTHSMIRDRIHSVVSKCLKKKREY